MFNKGRSRAAGARLERRGGGRYSAPGQGEVGKAVSRIEGFDIALYQDAINDLFPDVIAR